MKLPEKLKKAWSGLSLLALNARIYLAKRTGRVPHTSSPITTRIVSVRRKHYEEHADTLQLRATGVARRQEAFEKSVLTGYIAKRNRVTAGKGRHKFIHPSTPA